MPRWYSAHARLDRVALDEGGREEVGAMAKSFAVMQEVPGSIVTSPDSAREGVRGT